jgi:hypothetical protein
MVVCLCTPTLKFSMVQPIFMKLFACYDARVHFNDLVHKFHSQALSLYVYPAFVVRQRLGKNHPKDSRHVEDLAHDSGRALVRAEYGYPKGSPNTNI